MINMLVGQSGGGKSYEAVVYHILAALKIGRKVITNLPLNLKYIEAVNPEYIPLIEMREKTKAIPKPFDAKIAEARFKKFGIRAKEDDTVMRPFANPEDYEDDWRHPDTQSGALFVIDECHKCLPARGTSVLVEEWFAEHRHSTSDVLLITQSDRKVSPAITDNVQVLYRVKKAVAFGSQNKYIRKVFDGVRGDNVNTSIREYQPRYFNFYKSHTKGGGKELSANDIIPIWYRWPFIGTGICIAALICLIAVADFGNPLQPQIKQSKQVKQHVTQQKTESVDLAIKKPIEMRSKETQPDKEIKPKNNDPYQNNGIHIVGHIKSAAKSRWYLALSQNGQRLQIITGNELIAAGYKFEPINDCAAWVTYKETKRFLLCDVPVQSAVLSQS